MTKSLFQPKPWLDLFRSYDHSFNAFNTVPPKPKHHKPPSTLAYGETTADCGSEFDNEPENEPLTTIFCLPPELIHHILSILDAEQFSILAQVSYQFLPFVYDPRHWRRIAQNIWPNESLSTLEKKLHQYKTWRKLCTLRPRLRTNGIYVVRHQYAKTTARSATEEPIAPVFLVTYYRLLRFFTDGTVVSLTTCEPPHLAVKRVRRSWYPVAGEREKSCPSIGHYEFKEETHQVVLTLPMNHPRFPQMRTGTVYMHLSLSSTEAGACNRLTITDHYTIMDHDGGELVPYTVENKPYRLVSPWDFKRRVYEEFPRDDHDNLAQWFEMKKAARASRRSFR